MDMLALAKEIAGGRRLSRNEDVGFFIDCDLKALCEGADYIRQRLCGSKVDLCTIINGRSGRCGEDCKYCAQSAHHHTDCESYSFLDADKIVAVAKANEKEGADRFAIVTSGRALSGEDFESAVAIYERLHRECRIGLCTSLGIITAEQFRRLRAAGVTSYHHNIETSEHFFPRICTTHSYQDRISTIRRAQEAGMCVCSGGIIGMGESWQDRIDMAFSLAELGIRSIPINVLMAIKGTPLENQPPLPDEDVMRTFALFRYINPAANIRLAGGRKLLHDNGKDIFDCGASASITGNMLTTSGSTIKDDRAMLAGMGRDVVPAYLRGDRRGCGEPGGNTSTCAPDCCAGTACGGMAG